MHGEGIPELVGTNIMHLSRLRIHQLGKPGLFGAFLDYLPGSMTRDVKEQSFTVICYRAALLEIVINQFKSIIVNGEHPLSALMLVPLRPEPKIRTFFIRQDQKSCF